MRFNPWEPAVIKNFRKIFIIGQSEVSIFNGNFMKIPARQISGKCIHDNFVSTY